MPKNNRNIWGKILLVGGLYTVVFLISASHFWESDGIKIYGDEIGYWRNAALLTGRDWSGEASSNAYYGFGYGFLLMPILFFLNEKPDIMMHAAIIMQSLMLASCIIAAWLILEKLDIDIKQSGKAIILLFSVLYPSNIFYTKTTLSEILLSTCVWWNSYFALCYVQEKKVYQAIGLALVSVYMFSVHQRMLTTVVASFLLIMVITIIKRREKMPIVAECIAWIAIFAVLFTAYQIYDAYYTNSLYSQAIDGGRDVNRVSTGLGNRIIMLKTMEGMLQLIKSLCGKIFYSFVASYGVIAIGIGSLTQNMIRECKQKDKWGKNIWYIYLLLNFLGAIGASALAMNGGFETRSDRLMYGRYSEYTYGPILLMGAITLYQVKQLKQKMILFNIVLITMLCVICVNNTFDYAPNSNFWVNCVALSDLVCKVQTNELTNKGVVLMATLRCIIVMGILFGIGRLVKKYQSILINAVLAIIIVSWIYTMDVNWKRNVLPWYIPLQSGIDDMAENIENEDMVITLDATLSGCFQFRLPNVSVKICSSIEEIPNYTDKIFVITDTSSEYAIYIREHYTVDKENEKYIRWIFE